MTSSCLHLSKEEVQRQSGCRRSRMSSVSICRQREPLHFHDVIYGDITVNNEELEDLILIKSDGYPTYNFANVVDDHLMGHHSRCPRK